MIKLNKGVEPDVLTRHGARWTNEFLTKLANGDKPSEYLAGRYADPQIKAALLLETHEKCAYCESSFRHVTYGDVEHIVPKSDTPALRFAWTNLTVACDVCNTNKSDTVGLIDPYAVDPTRRFYYAGALMWGNPGDDDAFLTEVELQLNRDALVERRTERINYIRALVASAVSKRADVKAAMLRIARDETGPSKPYSACARSTLDALLAVIPR